MPQAFGNDTTFLGQGGCGLSIGAVELRIGALGEEPSPLLLRLRGGHDGVSDTVALEDDTREVVQGSRGIWPLSRVYDPVRIAHSNRSLVFEVTKGQRKHPQHRYQWRQERKDNERNDCHSTGELDDLEFHIQAEVRGAVRGDGGEDRLRPKLFH